LHSILDDDFEFFLSCLTLAHAFSLSYVLIVKENIHLYELHEDCTGCCYIDSTSNVVFKEVFWNLQTWETSIKFVVEIKTLKL